MKKTLKRLSKFLGVLTLLVLIGGIGIYYLEMKTQSQIEAILGETFEPSVDSIEVNLSFFHRFPHPYLCVQNIKVNDHSNDTIREILSVSEADAEVNFLKLWKGDYEIKSLNIQEASLHFLTDSLGKSIRLFKYKERDTSTEKGHFLLNLPKLHFEEILLIGQNDYKKSSWEIKVDNANFKGLVESGIIDLDGEVQAELRAFSNNGKLVLENKPLELGSKITIDPFEKTTSFNEVQLNFSDTNFQGEGGISSDYPNGDLVELNLIAENEFDGLFGLLPNDIQSQFEQTNEDAKSEIKIEVAGLSNSTQSPDLEVSIDMVNASVLSTEYGARLDSLNFQVMLINQENFQELTIQNFRGKLKDNPIRMNLKLIDFQNPDLELDFEINMDLNDLSEFIPLGNIKKLGGKLVLNGMVEGQLNSENELSTSINGLVDFKNDELILRRSDLSFRKLNGEIIINDSLLTFRDLKGDFTNIPFTLNGAVENSYRLFQNNKKDLDFDLKIYSRSVNLNNVFNEISSTGKKVNKGKHPLVLPWYFDGIIHLKTPQMKYRDAVAQNFSTTILLKNGEIIVPKLSTDVLHGHFSLSAKLKKKNNQYFDLESQINLGNINTKRLLQVFRNFEQNVLTSEQLEGRLSANIKLNAWVDKDLILPSEGTSYLAEFSLRKAELIDFEPIVKALRHVKKKEAAHVHIDNLKGKALYHRHQMYIPYLNFKSNLTSISLYGNRKPNEFMDFNVELSLKELLFSNKKRKKNKRKSKKDGGMDVRVNLAGKPGKMKVKPRTKKGFEEMKKETNRAYTKMKRSVF